MANLEYVAYLRKIPESWGIEKLQNVTISIDDLESRLAGIVADIPDIKTPFTYVPDSFECLFHSHVKGKVLYIIFDDTIEEYSVVKQTYDRYLELINESIRDCGAFESVISFIIRKTDSELIGNNNNNAIPKYCIHIEIDYNIEKTFQSIKKRRKTKKLHKRNKLQFN